MLGPYPARLREAALRQVQSLGVEVILGRALAEATDTYVRLDDGTMIQTHTLIWGAGVKATPLASLLNVPLQRGGRIPIQPTTEVVGKPHVYAVGDIAYLEDNEGRPYPMLIPVAQQQGKLAAKNILADRQGQAQQPFQYNDRGTMATIGRRRAVAWIYNRIQLTGLMAWFAWLGLHLIMLLGFRNRVNVFINWAWNYLTYDRSVRIIWVQEKQEPTQRESFPELFVPIRDEPAGNVAVHDKPTNNAPSQQAIGDGDGAHSEEVVREA
ncbi:MAG: FAD-dependent oxidoreductase [Caldilineaceae bacterium]